MNKPISSRRLLAAAPLWVLAGVLLSAAPGRADEPPKKRRHTENRFLFVVDTSAAMRLRSNGVEKALVGLIESGMNGELRPNDTIGLWTYGEQLDTDFPMLMWSEKRKGALADQVLDHLHHLHYEKRSRLDKALPALRQVIADSERVTVIFVFDGSGVMSGTPFDKDINDLHKKYAHDFRAAHEPFVTVLAARDGVVFDYTINFPGSVIVPQTADPLPPPETNAPPPVLAQTPPPPVEPNPPPHRLEIIQSGSNLVTHGASAAPPAASEVAAVVTPAPAPAPEPMPAPVTNAPTPAAPAPAPVAVQETNTTNSTITIDSPVAPPRSPPPAAQAALAPAPAPVAVVATASVPQVAMFIIAFSLLTIAVVLVVFLVRRWRGDPQSSLISRSIDRSR
jgi:hypothetical protein